MKKLRSSLAAKICAWVLTAACLTAAGISLLLAAFGWDGGVYRSGGAGFFDTSYAYSAMYRFAAQQVEGVYQGGGDLEEMETFSDSDRCNFRYCLTLEDGTVVSSTLEDGSAGASVTYLADWGDGRGYEIRVALKPDLPNHSDDVYRAWQAFRFVEANAWQVMAVLAVSAVLALLLIVYLVAAAGHKVREGQMVLAANTLDKIPLDVYTVALGLLAGLLLAVTVEWNLYGADLLLSVVLPSAALLAAALVALAWLLSFTTRVKLGKWWRNTVIYRVLRIVWRLLRRAGRGLRDVCRAAPIVWKLLVVTAGLLVLLFILGLLSYESGAMIFLDFLLCLAILAAVGLAGLQLRTLQKGGEALAAGDLDARVDTSRMFWDFKRHGENLNAIGDGMAIAVEQRLKSERLKTELITNVSHDIKTPLTSILNYVDLLQHAETEEQKQQYLEVLQRQAVRLKKLTEDLVEASKASTGTVTVTLVPTNAVESVNQALGEYAERLAAGNLTPVTDFPEDGVTIRADGRLLWRVLDNLLNNICKYALAGTRVYVTVAAEEREVVLTLKNISRQQLNISADELMERFVRGDASRTTEGSGLGLNIARSLTELQKGTLRLEVDGDLFKVELRFPKV